MENDELIERLLAQVGVLLEDVYFAVDRAAAPKGDEIYTVTTPVEGMSRLFLQRASDRGAKAILIALIA